MTDSTAWLDLLGDMEEITPVAATPTRATPSEALPTSAVEPPAQGTSKRRQPTPPQGADDEKYTKVSRAANRPDDAALLKQYRDQAKEASKVYGCANCRGIETFKSIAAVAKKQNKDDGELEVLLAQYPDIMTMPFGACEVDWYLRGVENNAGQTINPFNQKWCPTVPSTGPDLKDKRYQAVTKKPAKAHAVVSRKTLSCAFRYGPAEYLAAPSAPGHRDIKTVINQAMQLAGSNQPDTTLVFAHWQALLTEHGKAYFDTGEDTYAEQAKIAREITNSLAEACAKLLSDPGMSTESQRPQLAGLCTVTRVLILSISAQARRAKAWPVHEDLDGVHQSLSCADDEPNVSAASYLVKSIKNDLDRINGAKKSIQLLNNAGLDWQSARAVEFGHQCGICEGAQGDDDLIGRMLNHRDAGMRGPTPHIGVGFADLWPPNADAPPAKKPTAWDLANSVASKAVELYYKGLRDRLHRKADNGPFLEAALAHLDQTAPLFVAYMQVLLLDLAYSPDRRLIRVLVPKSN